MRLLQILTFLGLLVGLGLSLSSCSQRSNETSMSLEGRWEGVNVHRAAQMKLVLDLQAGANGLRGRLFQPDYPLRVGEIAEVNYNPPAISFQIEGTQLRFEGTRDGESIRGTSRDGEFTATFELKRSMTQTPPQSFREQEVSFQSNDARIGGTLLLPVAEGQYPGVVLIHGSGPGPRAALRPMAETFSRNGIAALIYDKRDVGNVRGTELVESENLIADALAAVKFLGSRSEINARQLGVWGVSQGGGVAAEVAARSREVAFMVGVSSGGVTYAEMIVYQITNRLRAQNFSQAEIEEATAAIEQLHEFVRTRKDPEALQATLDRAWKKRWGPIALPTKAVPTDKELSTWIQWRRLDTSPVEPWQKLTVPVLAIWGEKDLSVPVNTSVARITAALARAQNRDATIKIFPGADHGLTLPMGIRSDTEGAWDWPRIAPGYLELTMDWVKSRATAANSQAM